MDPITLGMLISGGGQLFGGVSNWLTGKSQQRETQRRQNMVEPFLMQLLGGGSFNTGQDGLMQSLRADPMGSSATALESLIGSGGNPFDTTELFESLGVMDQRARGDALSEVRAGATGLGQRFGTAMNRQQLDTVSQLLESAAARNAGIAMQSHGDAQSRLLEALGLMDNRRQGSIQAANLLLGQPMAAQGNTLGEDIGAIGSLVAFNEMMKRILGGSAPGGGEA